MDKRRAIGLAISLILVSAAPALALDNVPAAGSGRCDCMCETANTGSYSTYDSRGYGCGALNNRTCNIENPSTGLIETGRLWGCSPESTAGQSAIQNGINGGMLQQDDPAGRPGLVAPLLNGTFAN